MPRAFWTEDQDARLTEMWADPRISSSQIASELGYASRNAIIGRVHRLGLPMRNRPGGNTFRQRAPRKKAALPPIKSRNRSFDNLLVRPTKSVAPKPLPPLNVADSDIPAAQRRTISSLTNETCRWPIGDPGTPGFFFCGHASADVDGGQPYCATHAKRAFSGAGAQRTGRLFGFQCRL